MAFRNELFIDGIKAFKNELCTITVAKEVGI